MSLWPLRTTIHKHPLNVMPQKSPDIVKFPVGGQNCPQLRTIALDLEYNYGLDWPKPT